MNAHLKAVSTFRQFCLEHRIYFSLPFALLPHKVVTNWSKPLGATVKSPVLIHSAHWTGGNEPIAGLLSAAFTNWS